MIYTKTKHPDLPVLPSTHSGDALATRKTAGYFPHKVGPTVQANLAAEPQTDRVT